MFHINKLSKSRCISNAQIQFVSLVDNPANKKTFLITKARGGIASFSSFGKIVKTDINNHYVTGIVYEPMVEDAQGDFMTEDEIQKAAVWYAKNGNGVDLQHNFSKLNNAVVVESMVAKADFYINQQLIKKGTWLITVEISDSHVWNAIRNGRITGFSMGGNGTYSEEDIYLNDNNNAVDKGFLKSLAKKLGVDGVPKNNDLGNSQNQETLELNAHNLQLLKSVYQILGELLFDSSEDSPKTLIHSPDDESINKAFDFDSTEVTRDDVLNIVSDAVTKAVEPLYLSRGIPTNLNNEHSSVRKNHEVFDGLFI